MTDPVYSPLSGLFFDDVAHRALALDVECRRLCSYLIATAAVQRGLEVHFAGSTRAFGRKLRGTHREAAHPRLFQISDGAQTYLFDHSCGDMTERAATAATDDKFASKLALSKAGIRVPPGGVYRRGDTGATLAFLRKHPRGRFLIKPVFGSHSIGVVAGLSRDQAVQQVRAAKDDTPFLLEEQILGAEYRVYVVDGKIAGAWRRAGAYVTGDGQRSIGALITARNLTRRQNPQMRTQIINVAQVAQFLSANGKSINMVPVFGQKVTISGTANSRGGGWDIDVFGAVPDVVAQESIGACRALNLPNGGVDIIERAGRAFVLEVNSKAAIGKHSFPEAGRGSGNTVAEAIVDHYFPSSGPITRDHGLALEVASLNAEFREYRERTHYVASVKHMSAA